MTTDLPHALTAVNGPRLVRQLDSNFGLYLRDSWAAIGRILTVSRLKYKPDPLLWTPASIPISEIDFGGYGSKESFGELCDVRAKELLVKAEESGLPFVNVLWSGGIDSTLALVSLLKNWPEADRKRLRIVCSRHSIEEYPWFYNEMIVGQFPVIDTMLNPYDSFFDDAIAITGEFGDQIFGSDIIEHVANLYGGVEDLKTRPWRWSMTRYFERRAGERVTRRFLRLYAPIVKEAPFYIFNAIDFLWWWNFSQKWQYVKFRGLLYSSEQNIARNAARINHFFEPPMFQRWSIANHDKKMPGDWTTYKLPAKELIVEFTKDREYLKKPKVRSLMNLNSAHKWATVLTDKWSFSEELLPFANPEFDAQAYGET